MAPSPVPSLSPFGLVFALALAAPVAVGAPVSVFVGAPPQKHLVDRVGGGHVAVTALVRQGQDPHHFSLTPSQAVALGKADAYFATGLPFETGVVERLEGARPGIPLVNLATGIELLETGPDHCTGRIDITPEHHQPYGVVHGGVYCTFIETLASMGAALWAIEQGMAGADQLRPVRRQVRNPLPYCAPTTNPPFFRPGTIATQ